MTDLTCKQFHILFLEFHMGAFTRNCPVHLMHRTVPFTLAHKWINRTHANLALCTHFSVHVRFHRLPHAIICWTSSNSIQSPNLVWISIAVNTHISHLMAEYINQEHNISFGRSNK